MSGWLTGWIPLFTMVEERNSTAPDASRSTNLPETVPTATHQHAPTGPEVEVEPSVIVPEHDSSSAIVAPDELPDDIPPPAYSLRPSGDGDRGGVVSSIGTLSAPQYDHEARVTSRTRGYRNLDASSSTGSFDRVAGSSSSLERRPSISSIMAALSQSDKKSGKGSKKTDTGGPPRKRARCEAKRNPAPAPHIQARPSHPPSLVPYGMQGRHCHCIPQPNTYHAINASWLLDPFYVRPEEWDKFVDLEHCYSHVCADVYVLRPADGVVGARRIPMVVGSQTGNAVLNVHDVVYDYTRQLGRIKLMIHASSTYGRVSVNIPRSFKGVFRTETSGGVRLSPAFGSQLKPMRMAEYEPGVLHYFHVEGDVRGLVNEPDGYDIMTVIARNGCIDIGYAD